MSKVIYIEKTDTAATLTTWIYCAFIQMYAAEQQGCDAYIHWPFGDKPSRCLQAYVDTIKFSEKLNMYDWFFKQPKIAISPSRFGSEVWTWETDGDKMQGHSLMSQPLSVIKDYYKKHLYFSDEVNQRGQALVKKYNIDFSNTIGITWRGTDIYLDGRPRVPIETYFPFIDEVLKPGMKIMCSAEEETILQPLLNRYPQAFNIDEFVSAKFGAKDNPERNDNRSGFERGLQPALMVWLFSKCAHYIKNRSSTGAVASWLSSGRIVSIFHPENLGFPANTDTVEIEGKQYTTDNKLIEV